jgi:hypothetical protein
VPALLHSTATKPVAAAATMRLESFIHRSPIHFVTQTIILRRRGR